MSKEKFLIVGSGGREAAFARALSQEVELYAVTGHANPTIVDCAERSGGKVLIANPSDPQVVTQFACDNNIDYTFVSADDPLAAGVVDVLLANGLKAVGGTKAATRIEWDKIYSISLVQQICPDNTPYYTVLSASDDIDKAIQRFADQSLQVVVKPQGLTGGKGVKVMPEHLPTYEDAALYAKELLQAKPNEQVLLVEKLQGIEFTIMGLTDGEHLVLAPASYDYPFRYAGDTGPGTGGMGCFTDSQVKLPFMSDTDLEHCRQVMQKTIDEMRKRGLNFSGVLNAGFFLTPDKGIQFMEYNARFGDPEGLNVLSVLRSSFSEMIRLMWKKQLSEQLVIFEKKASVVKYLVAAEYPQPSAEVSEYTLDEVALAEGGIQVFHSAAVRLRGNTYQTLKKSRAVALGATADTIELAAEKVNAAIAQHVDTTLEYRADIGIGF